MVGDDLEQTAMGDRSRCPVIGGDHVEEPSHVVATPLVLVRPQVALCGTQRPRPPRVVERDTCSHSQRHEHLDSNLIVVVDNITQNGITVNTDCCCDHIETAKTFERGVHPSASHVVPQVWGEELCSSVETETCRSSIKEIVRSISTKHVSCPPAHIDPFVEHYHTDGARPQRTATHATCSTATPATRTAQQPHFDTCDVHQSSTARQFVAA